jgi:hypothetical protein
VLGKKYETVSLLKLLWNWFYFLSLIVEIRSIGYEGVLEMGEWKRGTAIRDI